MKCNIPSGHLLTLKTYRKWQWMVFPASQLVDGTLVRGLFWRVGGEGGVKRECVYVV